MSKVGVASTLELAMKVVVFITHLVLVVGSKRKVQKPQRQTGEQIRELGEPTVVCSGCEYIARHLQGQVTQELVNGIRVCKGDPACLKSLLATSMRKGCAKIGETGTLGIVGNADREIVNLPEVMQEDHPKHKLMVQKVDMDASLGKVLTDICRSLVSDPKWIVQLMMEHVKARGPPLVSFNMSTAACGKELNVCRYSEKELSVKREL